jgi:putative peptide zinc metalloprotease protein
MQEQNGENMVDYSNIELVERDNYYIICNHSIFYKLGKKEGSLLANLKNGFPLEDISEQMAISVNDLKLLLNVFEENGIIGAPQKEKEFILAVQFPLFSPDAFLSKVVDQARDNKYFVFFTFLLSNLLILLGTTSFLVDRKEIFNTNIFSLNASEYVQLSILFFFTKALHEFAHGLACKFYGCAVGNIGLRLILLAPSMYCDTSEIRFLPDKNRQIITCFAGLYVNLFILSITSLLYYIVIKSPVMSVVIIFNFIVIVANIIPFVRLDGYRILCFALGITNLYTKSLKGVLNIFHHCTLQEKFIAIYGAFNWCFIVISLYFGALFTANLLADVLLL